MTFYFRFATPGHDTNVVCSCRNRNIYYTYMFLNLLCPIRTYLKRPVVFVRTNLYSYRVFVSYDTHNLSLLRHRTLFIDFFVRLVRRELANSEHVTIQSTDPVELWVCICFHPNRKHVVSKTCARNTGVMQLSQYRHNIKIRVLFRNAVYRKRGKVDGLFVMETESKRICPNLSNDLSVSMTPSWTLCNRVWKLHWKSMFEERNRCSAQNTHIYINVIVNYL